MGKINTQHTPSPKPTIEAKQSPRITFSFRFFNETDLFGFQRISRSWFSSLMVRMTALSNKLQSDLLGMRESASYRFHKINWNQPKIPIQRSDLTWLNSDYRDNEEDFPMMQITISQALGRIIGFFDESGYIFNIVLLDPMHNIQPTQSTGYRVDKSDALKCHYSSLILDIEKFKRKHKDSMSSDAFSDLENIPSIDDHGHLILTCLDDDFIEQMDEVIKNQDCNIQDILESGILSMMN